VSYREHQRLADDLLATQPSIPWRQIARMRDHLAHRYFDTAHAILQPTVDVAQYWTSRPASQAA
jgi:uncharacterized protein with HEPN domain